MGVIFSRHAKRQMKWRKISRAEVLQVLDQPEHEEPSYNDKVNLYRTINNRHLKVTIKRQNDGIIVVTAIIRRKGI